MKKSKKWILVSMIMGLVVIIMTVFLTINGTSIVDIQSKKNIIGLSVVILVSLFIILFIHPKVQNLSLQKKRIFLLILLSCYIIFLLVMTIIRGISFWEFDISRIIQWLVIIVIFLIAFFQKDKEKKSKDGIKE